MLLVAERFRQGPAWTVHATPRLRVRRKLRLFRPAPPCGSVSGLVAQAGGGTDAELEYTAAE
ncbi:hypothetical protein GCM10023100_00520 [Actinocorallia cavernae]|uniref:Uncharacterized protein n=2 Tax=Actinomycetes TaxID=1760 RepID=A0ABP8S5U0_9ACTN